MFKVIKRAGLSRLGKLTTAHGVIATPFFMPVGTRGQVKFLSSEDLRRLNSPIMLANTYHLMLKPGADYLKKQGGLHKFIDWDRSILTDSGGYQVFSLGGAKDERLVKITKEGVEFRSHLDGGKHFLTPEKALDLQTAMGVDIAVCLDECVALPSKHEYLESSVDLTQAWAQRTKRHWQKKKGKKTMLFAVIQGGLDKDLRLKSLAGLKSLDFDGYNIGGLSVGESAKEMYQVLDYLVEQMPADKPRYLMGVGYPENIVAAVKRGVDMFDCVIPSREGRHGRLYAFKADSDRKLAKYMAGGRVNADLYSKLNMKNAVFEKNKQPINPESNIAELRNLTFSYLSYLIKIDEPLGQRLITLNNIEFYLRLMEKIRKIIKAS